MCECWIAAWWHGLLHHIASGAQWVYTGYQVRGEIAATWNGGAVPAEHNFYGQLLPSVQPHPH